MDTLNTDKKKKNKTKKHIAWQRGAAGWENKYGIMHVK